MRPPTKVRSGTSYFLLPPAAGAQRRRRAALERRRGRDRPAVRPPRPAGGARRPRSSSRRRPCRGRRGHHRDRQPPRPALEQRGLVNQLAVVLGPPAALEERAPARPGGLRHAPALLRRDTSRGACARRRARARAPGGRRSGRSAPGRPAVTVALAQSPEIANLSCPPAAPLRAGLVAHARVDVVRRGVVGEPDHVAEASARLRRLAALAAARSNATSIIALLRLAERNVRSAPRPFTPPRSSATAKRHSPSRPRAKRRAAAIATPLGTPAAPGAQGGVDAHAGVDLALREASAPTRHAKPG